MSLTFSDIPLGYDIDFIAEHAAVTFGGQSIQGESTRVYYMDPDGTKFDAVAQTIVDYETLYAVVRRPQRIAEVQDMRDAKIVSFTFNGIPIDLSLETKANLTGAVSGLDRNADVAGLDWSLGAGEFIYLDRASVYALADAAFLHVQGCFSHGKTIVTALKAATTITEIDAVDITVGWPNEPVPPA